MWTRGLSVCAVLSLAMGAAAGNASASPQANWAAGVKAMLPGDAAANPNVSVSSISCPSPGNCVAAGSYNTDPSHTQALLLTEASGTWAPGIKVTVPAGATLAGLDSVSCPSAGNCAAVGLYQDASGHTFGLVVTETSGTWGTASQAPLPSNAATPNPSAILTSVSCPSAGNCAAVGFYNHDSGTHGVLLTETGGTWSAQEAGLPSGALANPVADLTSVSCPSVGNCGAVGTYIDGGGQQIALLTEASGAWAQGVKATLPNAAASPGAFVGSISCPAAGECSAGGGYLDSASHHEGLLLDETGGTWATGLEITPPAGAATDPGVNVLSVSCPAVGECSAVGNYEDNASHFQGLLLNESSGTWAHGIEATLPSNAGIQGHHFAIRSVSCASAGNCEAVGNYFDGSGVGQGFFLTESSGTWGNGSEATFPSQGTNLDAGMNAVSCATVAACGAVGGYSDSSSNAQEGLFSTAPATPTLAVTAPGTGSTGSAIAASSVSAALASGGSPVGSITFRVFGPQSSPPTSCGSGGTALGAASVSGNGTYHPVSGFTPPGAGSYWWYASYSGDASDNPVGSKCGPAMAKTIVPGPVLTKFHQSHRRWRERGKNHKPPIGTTFSFKLSESATVTLAFSKHVPGRREKHRCVAPTKRNRHKPACTRRLAAGKLKLSEHAGKDKVAFRGVVSHHHRLGPGIYTVTVIAANANGRSAPKALTFTIVR